MNPVELATEYRKQTDSIGAGGVVVVYEGEVAGWIDTLRDPQSWQPGCLAIDEAGNTWRAEGGSEYDGAEDWIKV